MARSISLATAMIALVPTAAIAAVIAFDAGRSASSGIVVESAATPGGVSAQQSSYRVAVAPKTVVDLGHRRGCSPTGAIPPLVVCDIRTAFPHVGLAGTVTFVGSGTERDLAEALTAGLTP